MSQYRACFSTNRRQRIFLCIQFQGRKSENIQSDFRKHKVCSNLHHHALANGNARLLPFRNSEPQTILSIFSMSKTTPQDLMEGMLSADWNGQVEIPDSN